MTRSLTVLTLLLGAVLVAPAPAQAASRVTVTNDAGAAEVDPTYATTIKVSGTGFQSVTGGHGGVYVFFGTVRDGWRPSQGGQTGSDYSYVPDSESSDNQGYQRYIAFPGSDTAASAAGTMTRNGTWSTTLVVPGAVFQSVDRDGRATTVDCRNVTCGVITVGAHGVVNAQNETFTPVRVKSLYDGDTTQAPAEPAAPTSAPAPTTTEAADPESTRKKKRPRTTAAPVLTVDRASARAGHVLPFAASGLAPGSQISAVLDDGAAGAGPFLVGSDGGVAGVLTIPGGTEPGTHELRLFGAANAPTVSFAITAGDEVVVTEPVAAATLAEDEAPWAFLFAGAAALVLVLALVRLALVRSGARRG